MDIWLRENLVCPIEYSELSSKESSLVCTQGHQFPLIDEVPIMLLPDLKPTHEAHFARTFILSEAKNHPVVIARPPKAATAISESRDCFAPSGLAMTVENSVAFPMNELRMTIDPYVQREIAATCGIMYRNLSGRLRRYPIPKLPLSNGANQIFLDLGCNWGRWCVSAAREHFFVVGVDPSFEAIQAAQRISHQLGTKAIYLVADARHLPFRPNSFDVIFSYSVLQHFDKNDTRKVLTEIHRLLKHSGFSLIQMLNSYGLRNQYNMLKRKYREPIFFEVRYWTPSELKESFSQSIGPTVVSVDGFFSANAQTEDKDLLSFKYRCVIYISEFLKLVSKFATFMNIFADSLYLKSKKA